jgi:hypothetical protein
MLISKKQKIILTIIAILLSTVLVTIHFFCNEGLNPLFYFAFYLPIVATCNYGFFKFFLIVYNSLRRK